MDSLLEEVNSLIKMNVGEPYRLEHIKSRLEQNEILTLSDKQYLSDLLERYIRNVKNDEHQTQETESTISSEVNSDSIYCWKCGKENPNHAKFCISCGSPTQAVNSNPKNNILEQTPKIQKKKKMKINKKLLIGMSVFLVIIIIGGAVTGGTSASVVNNNDSKTPVADNDDSKTSLGISKNSQVLEIGESKHIGTVIIDIDKIEFFDNYATVFLSVENLGPDEAHLFETNTYVIQGKTQFKTKIPKPFGASGDWIEGYNIPPQIIKEGVIFLESWNSNEPFDLYLDAMYIRQDAFGGIPKDIQFVFNVEPKRSNSICGGGTIFDEETNSCIIK